MLPSYKPGDHVLTFNWAKITTGDVIVIRHGQKFLIKRVQGIKNGDFSVRGDNKKHNPTIKSVKETQIIGKVVTKY